MSRNVAARKKSVRSGVIMEGYVGEIRLFGGSFVPRMWLPCDGRSLLVRDNGVLYAVIGGLYGVDDGKTFFLPNLPAPALTDDAEGNKPQYIICVNGIYPSRV